MRLGLRVAVLGLGLLALRPAGADVPRVVTDIAPVHGLVSQVMAGLGAPDLIVPPGASPHGHAMRPSEARAVSQAELVVWVGPALTPWLSGPIETLAPEAVHLDLSQAAGVQRLSYRTDAGFSGAHDHDGDHDKGHAGGHHDVSDHDHDHDHGDAHDEGHGHGGDHTSKQALFDAHLWLDPRNAQAWLDAIANQLAALDPENAALYRKNATDSRAVLDALEIRLRSDLMPFSREPFVVFHDAYHYFEARFGLEAVAAITLGDAAAPGAARLAAVRDAVAARGASCALAEPDVSPGLIGAASGADALRIVIADPLGTDIPLGAEYYPQLLTHLADAFSLCLAR